MVNRNLYLKKIIDFRDKPLIKVITGMRRVGKSTLLLLYADYLQRQGVPAEDIVIINFESMEYDEIDNYRKLYALVKERIELKEKVYLLLDEIQQVKQWEKAVNALLLEGQADIYITGSNAWLLSSELSTLLSGRYVEITVWPLSFAEYLDFLPKGQRADKEAAFQNYLKFGSMPMVMDIPMQEENVRLTLLGIYNTVLMKDVVQRNTVRDPSLLEHLVRYLADNVGNPVSSKKISDYLTSAGRKTSSLTIDNYIRMLEAAYIFYKAQRYDIKGKLYLKTLEKYYIADVGIRNALLGFKSGDYGHILENVVYLELLRRGYEIGVGKVGTMEIDFVASKGDEKTYYQVAASVTDETTLQRELHPLQGISDNYEKVLLSMDKIFITNYDGIKQMNLIDFLLNSK